MFLKYFVSHKRVSIDSVTVKIIANKLVNKLLNKLVNRIKSM